ncbi:MAG: ChaN family lipoprotein [Verrucomicrobiota bacterium]
MTTFENVIEDLTQARVVYIGETHRIKRHHEWQLRILKGLHEKQKMLIIGLEQMEDIYQPQLDAFNRGELSFEELAEQTEWSKRWRNFRSYQPLVEFAQENQIPVVALNAKAEVIRKVGRHGLAALEDTERSLLPADIRWENDPQYRQLLDQLLMVHMPLTPEKLTPVFQAQVSRDEAMAENLVLALNARPNETIAIVIAGSGHMDYGLGIPPRITRRLGEHVHRILTFTNSGDLKLTEEEKKMTRSVQVSHDDLRFLTRPKSDYLLVTEAAENSEN